MNLSYMIYEAERPRTRSEQRADDIRRGELAAAISRLFAAIMPSRDRLRNLGETRPPALEMLDGEGCGSAQPPTHLVR